MKSVKISQLNEILIANVAEKEKSFENGESFFGSCLWAMFRHFVILKSWSETNSVICNFPKIIKNSNVTHLTCKPHSKTSLTTRGFWWTLGLLFFAIRFVEDKNKLIKRWSHIHEKLSPHFEQLNTGRGLSICRREKHDKKEEARK